VQLCAPIPPKGVHAIYYEKLKQMPNLITTDIIMENMGTLFEKHKVKKVAEGNFYKYVNNKLLPKIKSSIYLGNKVPKLDLACLQEKLKLIYWSVASVQFELGYMLIQLESNKLHKKTKNLINFCFLI